MSPNRIRRIVNASLWLAALISASVFLVAGIAKLAGRMDPQFEAWGFDGRIALVIGVLELVGAIGLLLPRTAGWSALGLSVLMIGAIGTHVANADPIAALLPAGILGLLALVLWGRGLVMEPTTQGHVVATKNP
ncbi:MAG: DoxX family protein [Enhygromyxa sp.]